MVPPSPDASGSSGPPDDPPPSREDLYWDIDSETLDDPGAAPGHPGFIDPSPRHGGSDAPSSPGGGESLESPPAAPAKDRSRSLRKPRTEPLSFQTPGSAHDSAERAAEAAPLPAVNLSPRPRKGDPIEKAEAPPAALKMPLQRKSGEGVEKFTRFTSKPDAFPQAHADRGMPSAPIEGSGPVFGKRKETTSPGYQSSRLQEVIDQTYTHTQSSHRRMGHRHSWRRRLGGVLFGLTVTGLVAALIWTWTRGKPETSNGGGTGHYQGPAAGHEVPNSSLPDAPANNARSLAERQEVVREGLQALIQAPDWESKVPWVLNGERLVGRMKDFYLSQKGSDPQISALAVSQPVFSGGEWWFLLNLETPSGAVIRLAAKETPHGPRFDWENFVAYGSMPFAEFCSEKPKTPQFLRLQIQSSSQYQGKYSESEYQACQIAPRAGEPVLTGYAPLSSPAAAQIRALTAKSGWNAALLSLHWEPDAGLPNAVLVDQAGEITPPGMESGTVVPPADGGPAPESPEAEKARNSLHKVPASAVPNATPPEENPAGSPSR